MRKFTFVILLLSIIMVIIYQSKDKTLATYDISSPKAVVESYFLALNNKDSKFIKTTIADKESRIRINTSDLISAELLDLKEVRSSSDEILYNVIYRLQLKKRDMFSENGINTKQLILVKDNKNNKWILRSIGEG